MLNKEICWNITTKCNQGCKYCHRFLRINELSLEENKKILDNLIKSGITDITWTGGEALLYQGLDELLKIAHDNGIRNKLITNGLLLTPRRFNEISEYLDSLTLSLDSIDNTINEQLGRGLTHYDNINDILTTVAKKNNQVKIRINTVANSLNIDEFDDLINYFNQFNIDCWRIFKFVPLRETAIINKTKFDITDEQFETIKEKINNKSNIKNIEYRTSTDLEKKYVLIVANGDIVITNNGEDQIRGNALSDSLLEYIK